MILEARAEDAFGHPHLEILVASITPDGQGHEVVVLKSRHVDELSRSPYAPAVDADNDVREPHAEPDRTRAKRREGSAIRRHRLQVAPDQRLQSTWEVRPEQISRLRLQVRIRRPLRLSHEE